MFANIEPTQKERAKKLLGDNIIAAPDAVMDRAFTVPGKPGDVWPWFVQLGKHRAGWYFPRSIERFMPAEKRALRVIDPALQEYKVGQRIDDWGGKDGYLEIVSIDAPKSLVYQSTRGKVSMSWAITLWPAGDSTRVLIRLRITSSGHKWFMGIGEIFDKLTILGLAAGLKERLQ